MITSVLMVDDFPYPYIEPYMALISSLKFPNAAVPINTHPRYLAMRITRLSSVKDLATAKALEGKG